jgi:hypothetical protein
MMMYHCYQNHDEMHNNMNTHVHVKTKIMLFVNFITHCLLCLKQKFWNLFKLMEIIHFHNNTSKHK